MPYVPQFIPTNVEALQGTLNQHQQAYDVQTQKQQSASEAGAAIPTTFAGDAADKNSVMSEFDKVRQELDKQYNYDRSSSQYANDLSKEITKLKGNPLWSHLQQKEELGKMRQQLIATKGTDYYENFNPVNVSLKDRGQLQNWKPIDLKDVRESAALAAKEHASSLFDVTIDRKSVPGYIFRTEHIGYKDTNQAAAFLNNADGRAWLKQTIASRGLDPSDPKIYEQAYTAALSNLVGTEKTDPLIDREYVEGLRAGRGKKEPISRPFFKITNTGTVDPFYTKYYSKIKNTKTELDNVNAKLKTAVGPERDALIRQQSELQLDVDRTTDLVDEITNSPIGQKVKETGVSLLKKYLPSLDKSDLIKLNDTILDAQINTSGIRKSPIGDVLADIANGIANGAKAVFGTATGNISMTGQAISSMIEETKSNNDPYNIVYKLGSNVFTNAKNSGMDDNASLRKAMRFVKDLNNYYKGQGNFVNNGFNQIENEVNKNLQSGKVNVADIYTAPIDMSAADLKKIPTFLTNNLTAFDVIKEGSAKQMTDKEVEKISSIFDTKEGADKPGTSVQIAIDRESEPTLILRAPSGEKLKLKMNIAKMGDDVISELIDATGLPQIADVLYKDIKFANKTYTLQDNYLNNIISQRYRDLTPFQGLSITKDEGILKDRNGNIIYEADGKTPKFDNNISYTVILPKFKELAGSEVVTFNSKYGMMQTLDEIYNDYIVNRK